MNKKPSFFNDKIIVGCMRLNQLSQTEANDYIDSALEQEITFFDHADVYGAGKCEEIFGEYLTQNKGVREKITLQSKVGIKPGISFDFSYEHIVNSVENSLKRLKTDRLDAMLLHRPDALYEPEEIAKAFDKLSKDGKVLNFGVSNQNPMQIEFLKKYINVPIYANQLQFSIMHAGMVTSGTQSNMVTDAGIARDGYVLDYSRLNEITIQAWSPLQHGFFGGTFIGNDQFPELNACLKEIGDKYNVSLATIASAWILRHPAKMQVISGSINKVHFKEVADGKDITLTREEWYRIYLAAGHILP